MRVLDSETLELRDFIGSEIPRYAILSHRWEHEEVSYADFVAGKGPEMQGWSKVVASCAKAVEDGLSYVWVDSCCIDKTSSAELSEAIASMFKWYQNAEVCYAYLSDVTDVETNPFGWHAQFRNSKWFTRGWTLQELLAPFHVNFYTSDWDWIGSKATLDEGIRSITKITDLWDFKNASVAQKMSWAAKRTTTRLEDQAYSLLGLFDVHMPPLYGEGTNAFLRLQLAIIDKINDESIFAWGGWTPDGHKGLLAPSPRNFQRSSNIVKHAVGNAPLPTIMTSRGLGIDFDLFQYSPSEYHYTAVLNCAWQITQGREPIYVHLVMSIEVGKNGLQRNGDLIPLESWNTPAEERRVHKIYYFPQQPILERTRLCPQDISIVWRSNVDVEFEPYRIFRERFQVLALNTGKKLVPTGYLVEKWPTELYYHKHEAVLPTVLLHFAISKTVGFYLVLGLRNGRLWVDVADNTDLVAGARHEICFPALYTFQDCISHTAEFWTINVQAISKINPLSAIHVTIDKTQKLRWPRRTSSASGSNRLIFKPVDPGLCDWERPPGAELSQILLTTYNDRRATLKDPHPPGYPLVSSFVEQENAYSWLRKHDVQASHIPHICQHESVASRLENWSESLGPENLYGNGGREPFRPLCSSECNSSRSMYRNIIEARGYLLAMDHCMMCKGNNIIPKSSTSSEWKLCPLCSKDDDDFKISD